MLLLINFYPRSPCGERRDVIAVMTDAQSISIHALLAESDGILLTLIIGFSGFLSTLSLRRATGSLIMIGGFGADFYPRSPCGERLAKSYLLSVAVYFYPRSPCGERPDDLGDRLGNFCISIHALLAESDLLAM